MHLRIVCVLMAQPVLLTLGFTMTTIPPWHIYFMCHRTKKEKHQHCYSAHHAKKLYQLQIKQPEMKTNNSKSACSSAAAVKATQALN